MRRPAASMLVAGLLAGCVSSPGNPDAVVRAATPQDTARLQTELVQDMMAKRQYFAALAHLEDVERRAGVTPQSALLRAQCLRHTDQLAEAEAVFRSLLDSPLAGEAEHGLGLILARRDLAAAVRHLSRAVRLQPTDARARNDLGYALMLSGRLDDARTQIATAQQLAPDDAKSRNNLIVLMHVMGEADAAAQLENAADMPPGLRQQLRRQAAELTESLLAGQQTREPS